MLQCATAQPNGRWAVSRAALGSVAEGDGVGAEAEPLGTPCLVVRADWRRQAALAGIGGHALD